MITYAFAQKLPPVEALRGITWGVSTTGAMRTARAKHRAALPTRATSAWPALSASTWKPAGRQPGVGGGWVGGGWGLVGG